MKKLLICFVAVLAVALAFTSMANAADRAGKFQIYSGLGFNVGQGGNAAFYWNDGMDYFFNDMISINPNIFISVDGAFIFGIAPRARFTFDPGIENLEIFADAGAGFLVGDNNIKDYIFLFGGGAYYWLLDGHLGLGSDLNFSITGISGYRFRVLWSIASVAYRF
jgi:hypothetical protein